MLDQLPSDVKVRIFKDFLYHDFLHKFRRFFQFRINQQKRFYNLHDNNKRPSLEKGSVAPSRFSSYPFYDFNNSQYCSFVLQLIQSLETRYFEPWQMIYTELGECLELYFTLSGRFDIGYEINKRTYYRLRFDNSKIIGIFNVHFHRRT